MWEALVAKFARRYSNPSTRRYYERDLTVLFDYADVDRPEALVDGSGVVRVGSSKQHAAQPVVAGVRLSRVCALFVRWCVRNGHADPALVETLMGPSA